MFINNLTQHLPDFMLQFMSRIIFLSDLFLPFIERFMEEPKKSFLPRRRHKIPNIFIRLAYDPMCMCNAAEKVMTAKLILKKVKWKSENRKSMTI